MDQMLLSQAEQSHGTTNKLLPQDAGMEQEFYNMLMQMPAGILVLSGPHYLAEFANELFFTIIGKTPQEFLHKPVFETVKTASDLFLQEFLDNIRSSGKLFELKEYKVLVKRNNATETIWLNLVYQPLKTLTGAVERIMVLLTDVTEQVVIRQKQEAEEALLRKTKEQLELSISIGHIGIWHWDAKAGTLTWSKEQLALYGLKAGEFSGRMKDFHQYVVPEDLHLLTNTVQREQEAGGDYEYQFHIKRSDGELRLIQGRSRSFYNADGELQYRTGVNIDITEQKRAEQSLQQSEERFRSTFDNAAVGIAHVSPNGRWLDVNNRLCSIVGYTREELLSSTFQDITHPDDLNMDLRLLQEVLEGKRDVYTLEKRYIHKTGTVVWTNLTVSLVRQSNGEPKYFISVVEDIGERKRAEEKIFESEARYRGLTATLEGLVAERTTELQQSQAFLQSVIDTTQNGITTYAPIRNRQGEIVDFRISFINNMVSKDLGLLPADVIGKTVREVFPQAFENGAFDYLIRFVETGEGAQTEIVHKQNGGKLYFDLSLARMDEGVTVTVQNITEQKKAAQQLEELNRQLQEINAELQRSNEDLQQFAHVASHDLKEPIRKIRTFGSRLEDECAAVLPERGKLYLQKMLSSAERMFGLIEGVLNYSTINSLESSFASVNLNEVIRNIESDLEVVLHQSGGRLNREKLPTVHGSAVLLNQLFYNLLTNALKFSRSGVPPLISIGVKQVLGNAVSDVLPGEEAKEFVQVSVCDNGIGFKPEQAGKIFKTFTRLNSRDRYEGTGLGLALCKKIVERHHGYIYATGKEGEGACFYVLLPA